MVSFQCYKFQATYGRNLKLRVKSLEHGNEIDLNIYYASDDFRFVLTDEEPCIYIKDTIYKKLSKSYTKLSRYSALAKFLIEQEEALRKFLPPQSLVYFFPVNVWLTNNSRIEIDHEENDFFFDYPTLWGFSDMAILSYTPQGEVHPRENIEIKKLE